MPGRSPNPPSLLARVASFFSSLVDDLIGEDQPRAKARALSGRAFTSGYPLIPQSDKTGCGVTCVAMLARKDYEEVRAALFTSKRKRVFYTGYKDLRRGLEQYGLSLEKGRGRRFDGFAELPPLAIAAVEQSPPSKSHWHWVVFVREGRRRYVLDPSWEGVVRTDLRSIKGRTFLAVVEPPASKPISAKRGSRMATSVASVETATTPRGRRKV